MAPRGIQMASWCIQMVTRGIQMASRDIQIAFWGIQMASRGIQMATWGAQIVGCVYIQKCLCSYCYHSIAKRHVFYGQNHFNLVKFYYRSFCTHEKLFPAFPLFPSLFPFKILRN